jgi:hypothetical protein
MDIYIKFQGRKYNFRKAQGCFCKNNVTWEFLELSELFFKEKAVNHAHGVVDQVHGSGARDPWLSLNECRSSVGLWHGFN